MRLFLGQPSFAHSYTIISDIEAGFCISFLGPIPIVKKKKTGLDRLNKKVKRNDSHQKTR